MATIAETFDDHWIEQPGPLSTPCWIWQRAIGSHGYGMLQAGDKVQNAHRVSYTRSVGTIPKGLHILHKCDVRACVNPNHLWAGTNYENRQDSIAKGRFRAGIHRGEDNATAKLTTKEVRTIRRLVKAGAQQTDVAAKYGVHKTNISCICRRITWQHVE